MDPIVEDILMHYGVKRRSGRYPWGSGENPYQHGGDFLARVEELEALGKSQKEIAERVGVSQQTLTKWKDEGGWELKRVARTVSRDQIINKTLLKINELLDSEEDFNGDEFAKLSSQLEKIKGGYTMDDVADILTKFGDYIIEQSASDKAITTEFVQLLTKYQDKYLLMRINNG